MQIAKGGSVIDELSDARRKRLQLAGFSRGPIQGRPDCQVVGQSTIINDLGRGEVNASCAAMGWDFESCHNDSNELGADR